MIYIKENDINCLIKKLNKNIVNGYHYNMHGE